ncbi:MAG: antitoxin [Pseudomonadota bacterium]
MSKRLQVLLEEQEMAEIQAISRNHHMTVAEWVRQTLRAARRAEPLENMQSKLGVVYAAADYAFPAPDIDQMLEEIDRGYDSVQDI